MTLSCFFPHRARAPGEPMLARAPGISLLARAPGGLLLVCALTLAHVAHAVEPVPPPDADADGVQTIVVTGRCESRLGTAQSASAGTVTAEQIAEQPTLRPAEVMQLVPGLVVVQHAGGGKANQYYLRGFEMDHGTMFSTWVDGVPVNEVSHVHGPGYTDLNWLIPELIERIDFAKGPYDPSRGDFANAGSADLRLIRALPDAGGDGGVAGLAKAEAGTDGWVRLLSVASGALGGKDAPDAGTLMLAGEYSHYDGPWVVPSNYRKQNGVLRYNKGDEDNGLTLTAQGYYGRWLGNDQVPLAAIEQGAEQGAVSRYGSIDPDTGGVSGRYSLAADWRESDAAGETHATLYLVRYTLNLYSNFTGYLAFPDTGDGIQQEERRWTWGGHGYRAIRSDYLGQGVEDRFGLEVRGDDIRSALNDVEARRVWAAVRADHVRETMISPWYQNSITWTPWLASYAGVRADILTYANDSDLAANSGDGLAWRPSPKVGLRLGPWADTEVYAQAGLGISSLDIQGVTGRVQPGPYSAVTDTGGGLPSSPQQALSRTRGAEVGVHSRLIPTLDTTLSLWVLESQSEFVYSGDTGTVDSSGRPGRRWGVEWNNRWQPTPWLDVTADLALSRAHYTDQDNPVGNQIPESVRTMTAGQVVLHDLDFAPGFSWSLGWRYLGPRFLVEDASALSHASLVFNALLRYAPQGPVALDVSVLNLTNARYYDAQYWYQYRLPGQGPDGATGDVVHPSEPRQVRVGLTWRL